MIAERVLLAVQIERTPVEIPLPCYGLELDLSNAKCRACPHQEGCADKMDFRCGRVTLDKLRFELVPKAFGVEYENLTDDDPELPHLERTYRLCYQTVYDKAPPDQASRYREEIVQGMRQAGCSLRLYMLASMIGHQRHQETVYGIDPQAAVFDFSSKALTGKTAVERVRTYGDLCRRSFGTFSLSSLDTLLNENYSENEYAPRMLNSEIIAGTFIVADKIHHDGYPWARLYGHKEVHLDEAWLAIEETYYETILKPHREGARSDKKAINQHRHAVWTARAHFKKQKQYAIGAFQARQAMMIRAAESVVQHFGFRMTDFEMPNREITDPMLFWVHLGWAIRHVQCLRYVNGEQSVYDSVRIRQ